MGARVILADSETLFRGAIRALIESAGGHRVVAEVSDGPELLACIQQHRPDVVILDTALLLVDGQEVVQRAKECGHTPFFLLLSSGSGRTPLEVSLQAGATGYVSKADPPGYLLAAIEAARAGQTPFSSRGAIDRPAETELGPDAPEARMVDLSIREQEVLRMIADGLSSKEIAAALHISARTVDTHRSNLMQKLGTHKVVGLVRFAIREGMIDP